MSLIEATRDSLRGRLALSLVVGMVAVLAVSFVALHTLIRDELYRHLDNDLAARMRAVAEFAVEQPSRERVAEYMPEFRSRAHEDFFQIWDSGGRTLARSDSSAGRDLPRFSAVAGRPTYYDLVLPDGHGGRAVAGVFELPSGDARGFITVVMAEETENLYRLERRIHFMLFAIAAATIVAMLLIAMYSVQRGLAPVARFAGALEKIDPSDPQARVEAGPLPRELRPVASSFSTLLDRLLEALGRERRYARNVAHELRNPLAEIRLLADVGASTTNPNACQAAIQDIGNVAAEMERTVDALMALTRYEAGLESPQPEPLELSAELRRQTESLVAAAAQRELTIRLDLPGEVWVHTDSRLAHRLIGNLMGNAVSHSPRGSTVVVGVSPDGDVTVANPAPQLAPADVARLGERFFRVDTDQREVHAGLGLSLAAGIAKVLGLRLVLELGADRCLVAKVHGFRLLADAA